jgi:hypothetical protein
VGAALGEALAMAAAVLVAAGVGAVVDEFDGAAVAALPVHAAMTGARAAVTPMVAMRASSWRRLMWRSAM